MPSQIVFPCPNCGANQNVEEGATSTQCQFCGNTISVPEELRPKPQQLNPATATPQPMSFGGMGDMPGMAGLPGMFLNMDVGKLRAMAMAARAGDKAEAARLYAEAFGIPPDQAMQAAELMMSHHHVVLNQMQFGTPPVIQMGGVPRATTAPMQGVTYNLPSPPVVSTGQRAAGRAWSCCSAGLTLFIILVIVGAIAVGLLAVSPNLLSSIVSLFNQAIKP